MRVSETNTSPPPSKQQYKRYGFSYYFIMGVGGLHVFNKNLKVYIAVSTKVVPQKC